MSAQVGQESFTRLAHFRFDSDDAWSMAPAPQPLDTLGNPFGSLGLDFAVASLLSSGTRTTSTGGGTSGTSGSTSGTGTTTTASWIAGLVDPVIRADMTTASAGGTVSETGMAQLFSDLATELTADKTKLSSSQLNDLKTIAADLNVGETASAYVTYITDALIDGNAANTKWTGGAAASTTLGNLAVNSTVTQITELDDKWFLGTDLPSDTVMMSGAGTFTLSYSAVTDPLFGAGGPSMNDINQGYLGDCYVLASLAEVADQNPSAIESMITNNGNNTYGVRFFINGATEYVTVNDALPDGGTIFNSATDIWASLVEKAYAQVQACGVITGNSVNYGNSFSTIGNGGAPEYALEEITGASAITDFDASGASWSNYVYTGTFAIQSESFGLTTASVLTTLIADLGAGYDAVLSSYTNATDANGMTTLVADHAMSIYGYDRATGDLEIRNPWGTETGQYWDTTFEVSLTTLLAAGDTISVDNVSSSTSGVVTGALVSAAAALQANSAVTSFSILDSLADVSAALASLAADTKLTSITLTDSATPALSLTGAQYSADAAVLTKITSAYDLTVTGAQASAAAGLQANAHVTAFSIADSLADVSAAFAALAGDNKLTSITLTNTGTPVLTLTAAQYSADAAVLAKITGAYALTVTGALASAAAGLQANTHVTAFSITDSSADVNGALATLAADTKVTSITFTDTNTPTLTLTSTQYTADAKLLAMITSSYKLIVTGALTSAASGLQANTHVTAFSIADSSADVAGSIAVLNSDMKLTSITLTDSNPLSITYAQLTGDTTALSKLPATYKLSVSGVTAANAATVQANTHLTSFLVSDTAANITSKLSSLDADTKLAGMTISGTTAANTLNLTGSKVAATINLDGDTASVSAGLSAPSLTFIGTPDAITLGTGACTIDVTLTSNSGIETIANYQYGLDQLDINLSGALSSVLKAANTTLNGQNAIAIYSSANPTHGIVLTGVSPTMTASNLLTSHLVFSNGNALIG
ncbi:MAG: C2 family cysteine protease [Devosia sp.]|nr:C2 family cysteine protease [Devosia sp.]